VVLGLLIGGALGNLIDRVRLGHVTDFLDFGPWPIFNVADTAVVVGALVMAWLMWAEARAEARAESVSSKRRSKKPSNPYPLKTGKQSPPLKRYEPRSPG
jgi:lipoprotein signal peptidase